MAEVAQQTEVKVPDPIQDLIDRVTKEDPDATKDSIQEKIDEMKDQRKTLVEQLGKEKDASKQAKINEQIGKIDQTFPILEAKGKKLLDRAEKKLEARTDLAKDETSLKTQLDEKNKEITGLKPGSTELTKAYKEKGEIQKELDRLTGTEKARTRLEKAKAFQEEAKKVHADEEKFADQKLSDDLEGKSERQEKPGEKPSEKPADAAKPAETPAAPNAPTASPESGGTLADRADGFVGDMVVNIIGSPPKTGWEKFTKDTKVILMQIGLAIAGGGNHSWGAKLSGPERYIAQKVIGLTITDDGEIPAVAATPDTPAKDAIPKCKLEWGKPDPEFQGPDKTTQDVFAKYFTKEGWMKEYELVSKISDGKDGKITIGQLRDNYIADHPDDDNAQLSLLLQNLKDSGANDDDVFMDAVSRKGYLLLDKNTPAGTTDETAKPAETTDKDPALLSRVSFEIKKDEAATQKLNEWGVGFSGKTMVDPMGKTLHTFGDKDQVSLQLSDDGNISMKIKTEAGEKAYSLIADTNTGTVILKDLTPATPAVDANPASPTPDSTPPAVVGAGSSAPAPTPSSPTAS